jgi:hypothetical protein
MFGVQIGDTWLDALYGRADEADKTPPPPPPLPLWLPEIEDARKAGRILDPYEVALQMARGE